MAVIEAEVMTGTQLQLGFDYSQIDEGVRDEVKAAAVSIQQLGRGIGANIISIGKRLIEVKGMLAHGQFTAWIEGEFALSERVAQNYMNVAREYGEGQNRINCSVFNPSVLYLLAAPSTPPEVRATVETIFAETGKPPTRAEVKAIRDAVKPPPVSPARKVYVEPVASKPEPPLNYFPDSERIEIDDAELHQAGFHLVRQKYGPDGWTYQYWWNRYDAPQCGVQRGSAELAIEDARKAFASFHAPTLAPDYGDDPVYGMFTREWVMMALDSGPADSSDFLIALNQLATVDDLMEACANMSTEDKHHRPRLAAIKARLVEMEALPVDEPEPLHSDPIVAILIDPAAPVHTMAPGSLNWALAQAAASQVNEALRVLPAELEQGRRPVLEVALRNRGGVKAMAQERTVAQLKPEPDFRQEHAIALRAALLTARDLSRRYYGELTGCHTDTLEFERGVEAMVPRLESLLEILRDDVTARALEGSN
jgi:hypothetical protein